MKQFFIDDAYVRGQWEKNVFISVDDNGLIDQITPDARKDSEALHIKGIVIPSMPNLHSHAFQRAMAGLSEVAGNPNDSFWTWREQMYHLVERLTPEQVHAIAAYLYVDMLKGGYTQVAEFNYLHHDVQGRPYKDDDMSEQLKAAAKYTGIGQTLLPVLYSFSGFGDQPAHSSQKRFIQTTEQYLSQFETLSGNQESLQNSGICFHSLRAVNVQQIQEILDALPDGLPVHIHISEQLKEVNDCLEWCGQRPVEYLCHNMNVNERWNLIHATHLCPDEVTAITQRGAVAGICTTTEGNLGDGIFPMVDFLQQNGRWGVGSDSHVSLSAIEELRWLEYGQRLIHHKRNCLVTSENKSVGEVLWTQAAKGGAQACGLRLGVLDTGYRADWLELKPDEWMSCLPREQWLNRWLFAGEKSQIDNVYVAGCKVISNGHHPLEEKLSSDFRVVMKNLIR
ncbi:formimidoylglutamate deiminase [Vibrio salinus]|uniref:formimidoylglutamate deiminase n=1 Tax=Vibrio salinus TaxID=2899784 RepID=UPI001E4AF9E8|nr:formimidoylglutamate deiminase [Vibrio salinus]MCE0492789.1 formimidoylglutamate deiminase [Vibrio salinus]